MKINKLKNEKKFIVKTMVSIGIVGNAVFSFFFTAKGQKVSLRAQSKNSAFFAFYFFCPESRLSYFEK